MCGSEVVEDIAIPAAVNRINYVGSADEITRRRVEEATWVELIEGQLWDAFISEAIQELR